MQGMRVFSFPSGCFDTAYFAGRIVALNLWDVDELFTGGNGANRGRKRFGWFSPFPPVKTDLQE
jgi:hypothetical protein